MVPFSKFFAFTNGTDKLMLLIGTIGAIIAGAIMPCMTIFLGDITNSFDPTNGAEQMLK